MIRLRDTVILAYTKLRTHKVRTGITAGIAGMLFGLIIAMILITQGVFNSIDRFGQQSLADRTVLAIGEMSMVSVDYEKLGKEKAFIDEVQAAYDTYTKKKTAAALKYNIEYDISTEDPSPVTVTSDGKRTIDEASLYDNKFVSQVIQARKARDTKQFDIDEFVKEYPSAKVLGDYYNVGGGDQITLMTGSKSVSQSDDRTKNEQINLSIIDGSVTRPFVSSDSFDASKGEIPVIIPYSQAMSLLGIKAVDTKATSEEKLAQLREVRDRVDEISVSFCYRNEASRQLLGAATAQSEQEKQTKGQAGIESPALKYSLPTNECGAVEIRTDTRTAEEKLHESNMIAYQKEIGEYIGEPMQQKVAMRGVGIVGELDGNGVSNTTALIHSIAGSNLGYESWAIPSDLFNKLPEEARPAAIFGRSDLAPGEIDDFFMGRSLVEFSDREVARNLIEKSYNTSPSSDGSVVTASEFGSNSLLIDEMKSWTSQVIFWALVFVGGVAVVIMASMIGRTVADGRRESAVFRAIGAKRSDIASVYGMYALLLSIRAIMFALVLGVALALIVDTLYSGDATVGAHLAYASVDASTEFRLFSIWAPQLPVVIAVMLLSGLIASIIPVVRSARRNPINDMRDDT